jgi:acetylornithine/succinyldiaminopimelate/putrescine aminotransferase
VENYGVAATGIARQLGISTSGVSKILTRKFVYLVKGALSSMGTGENAARPVNRVAESCLERGVFISGFVPNTLRIAPALTIGEAECDAALAEIDRDCCF